MSGNTYGKLFTVTTAGESHGPALVAIVDGCPPGIELSQADLQRDLDRRKPGTSRHTTQRQEADEVEILAGVFEGKTTGCAIGLLIRNTDQKSKDYSAIQDLRSYCNHSGTTWLLVAGPAVHRVLNVADPNRRPLAVRSLQLVPQPAKRTRQ